MISTELPDGFSTPARAGFHTLFVAQAFPDVARLLEEGIFSTAKLEELIGPPHLRFDGVLASARDELRSLSQRWHAEGEGEPIRVAVAPAGRMFRALVTHWDFPGVELVGGFDRGIAQVEDDHAARIFPLEELARCRLDALLVAHEHIAEAIVDQAIPLLAQRPVHLMVPAWSPRAIMPGLEGELAAIERLCAGRQPVLLFTCIRPFPFLAKRFAALRRSGVRVLLVSLLSDVGGGLPIESLAGSVDYLFAADGNMLEYLTILREASPDASLIYTTASSSKIPLMAARCVRSGYYFEYNDLLTTMYDAPRLALAYGPEEAAIELRSEATLIRESRGMVHKYRENAVRNMYAFHGVGTPSLQFFPYPTRAPKPATRDVGEPIKIVLIGGISAEDNPTSVNTRQVYDVIDPLVGQGVTVDFFNAYDAGDSAAFAAFRAKAESLAGFEYNAALPPEELLARLPEYDVGWMVYDFSLAPPDRLTVDVTSARFFDYLEAGLAIVISREFEFMAEMVTTHGLGFAIDFSEVEKLGSRLGAGAVGRARKRVRRYAATLLMDDQLPRLIRFLGLEGPSHVRLPPPRPPDQNAGSHSRARM